MSNVNNKISNAQKLFGLNLKEIRLEQSLSQLDLAIRCDYEKTTISRIENGRTNVTLKTMLLLAEALSVPLKRLLDFEIEQGTNLE